LSEFIVQDHENALADGLLGRGNLHCIQKVERTVGGDGRRGAHGANEHHGLVALHGEVEEVCRLLKRVRAMGDHDARHVVTGKQIPPPTLNANWQIRIRST
jgi:hypothetical protein